MERQVRKAAVLGAGVMGAQLAAHLANAGIPCYLLDVVPRSLTAEEEQAGLSLDSRAVRDRLARTGLERALRTRPAAFYTVENAALIAPGNLEDDLDRLAEVDWILEAVVEDAGIKKALLEKVDRYRRPGTIISTNTSGISVNLLAACLSSDGRRHFLGTHFFNPPRYMKLLELVPGTETAADVVQFMIRFGEKVLGKGVVIARDTPNFIANRIGVYGFLTTVRAMLDGGYTVEEVDAVTGPAMGRPRTATFRTADMVGLDVVLHVARNVYENVADEEERAAFVPPPLLERLVQEGWLGTKSNGGFYRRGDGKDGGQIETLEWQTFTYRPRRKPSFPSVEAAAAITDPAERIRSLVAAPDRGGRLAWTVVKRVLLYAAARMPEIAGDVVAIDQALKWGFNWDLGPFEVWDALGVRQTVARMEKEGEEIPPLVSALLEEDRDSFYRGGKGSPFYFDLQTRAYRPRPERPGFIFLPAWKEDGRRVVKSNQGATLLDLGDGVACLEFHSRNDAIGPDIIQMIHHAAGEVSRNYLGLVIGHQGRNFAVGANLMMLLLEAQEGNWEEIDFMVRQFQQAGMALRYLDRPVVAAPFQMTLGGGCELCLAAHRVRAAAETYMGLVEVGAGLIPAGGGCKEMVRRAAEGVPAGGQFPFPGVVERQPLFNRVFETVARARVSTSAEEARQLGYLRPDDPITINPDFLLYDAKQTVLGMVREGFRPPRPAPVEVAGRDGYAVLKLAIYNLHAGGFISDYDAHVASKLAYVMSGGDVPPWTPVSEQYLLDLEREAFLSLCGERKTLERMKHLLTTGKPLRN